MATLARKKVGDPEPAPVAVRLEPIGVFHCRERYPYDAARQGALSVSNCGEVLLRPGCNFEQALTGLAGFSRVWLLYLFHHNRNWKPMIQPPRGPRRKIGVFATRAPYRPAPIGLSCVELVAVRGRRVSVRGHDLLDGTPVLDIKPYLPYADSFPDAVTGWLARLDEPAHSVVLDALAQEQIAWLEQKGVTCLHGFLLRQLQDDPLDATRKRLERDGDGWEIAYRTWRARFRVDAGSATVVVERIGSGYTAAERRDGPDRYHDQAVHRAFARRWPQRRGKADGHSIRTNLDCS